MDGCVEVWVWYLKDYFRVVCPPLPGLVGGLGPVVRQSGLVGPPFRVTPSLVSFMISDQNSV